MRKINSKIKRKIIEYLPLIVLFFIVGFLFGTYYQQIVFIEGAGKILSYTDIQINFNETKFVQEINNTFLPEWKKNLNESIQKVCPDYFDRLNNKTIEDCINGK